MILYIQTKAGKYFVIHPNGEIERTDIFMNPTDRWVMDGLQFAKKFIIPLEQITREWLGRLPKNQFMQPDLSRYRIVCEDCGSIKIMSEQLSTMWCFDRLEDTPYYQRSKYAKV